MNTNCISTRRRSTNSYSIALHLNIDKHSTSIHKNNIPYKIEKNDDIIGGFYLPKSPKSNLPLLKDSK